MWWIKLNASIRVGSDLTPRRFVAGLDDDYLIHIQPSCGRYQTRAHHGRDTLPIRHQDLAYEVVSQELINRGLLKRIIM